MRRWGFASCLCMLFAVPASAQPADLAATGVPDEPPVTLPQLGYAALPGGLHAPAADPLPKGMFGVATIGGFGWRSGLLENEADHRFGRGIGNFALAYGVHELVTVALALDGRYDRHFGVPRPADGKPEDGYVGDPRLLVRAGKAIGKLRVGGQLGVWVPGKDAPSIEASAISFDARGLLSLQAGPGTVSFNAGFRLDNSDNSAKDAALLSLADRVSLGVSEFHAVVGGAHFTMPMGRAFFGAEGSLDLFVGSGAPGPIIRGGVHGGIHLTPQWSVMAFAELAKVPGIDAADAMAGTIALIPYEPMITGGIGVQGRFGGSGKHSHIFDNTDKRPVEVIEYAEISGQVTDETGKPVIGAKVAVKLRNVTGTGATDDKGNFIVRQLPIGKTVSGVTNLDDTGAEVTITVENKKPATQTLTLVKGPNPIAPITLERLLPPGQLRALVRAAGTGQPIAGATVTIEPGGVTATSAADGTLSVDIPPGTYKATATAPGTAPQTLEVTIEENGVTTKNFELSK